MIKFRGNYSYRYVNMKHVYLISNSKPYQSTKMNFYTVPYTSQEVGSSTNNVIVGFKNRDVCMDLVKNLNELVIEEQVIAVCFSIDEAKYIASLMKIPLVILLDIKEVNNTKHYEIHYSFERQ
jgi:hypothetical protein